MSVFLSDEPLSQRQRCLNWGAAVALAAGGIVWGLKLAKQCASLPFGYAAQYDYAIAWFVAVGLFIVAIPLLVYWRTRWIGVGLAAGGLMSLLAFGAGMRVLAKENLVAWQHSPKSVSLGPDQQASAVIYFKKDIDGEQVESFTSSVLMVPATQQHQGRDFPPFVRGYLLVRPQQANGHWAVALTFQADSAQSATQAYLTAIKSDSRVETIFRNIAPDSLRERPSSR
jgi:hypothetical protein